MNPNLSVVATLYNAAETLLSFYERITEVAKQVASAYEIILVNDGSTDNSVEIARSLALRDPAVRLLSLSRNFGESSARMEGLRRARGEVVFLIPSDLEVAPEELFRFWSMFRQTEPIDLIYGVHESRAGSLFERVSRKSFYAVCNFISPLKVTPNSVGCHFMSRRFASALVVHSERSNFFAGLCARTGFTQRTLPVRKTRLRKGGYNLLRRLQFALECLVTFSDFPLKILFPVGVTLIFLGATLAGFGILRWCYGNPPSVAFTILASIWLLGGVLVCAVGIVGMYAFRTFVSTPLVPSVIVDEWTTN
jgi:putative glycosyltransferase